MTITQLSCGRTGLADAASIAAAVRLSVVKSSQGRRFMSIKSANSLNRLFRLAAAVLLTCVAVGSAVLSAQDRVQDPTLVLPPDLGSSDPLVLPGPIATSDVGPVRLQSALPPELILPPPSEAAKRRASRFVEAEINPELPLSLVIGRPKILRLSETPTRIYVPSDDTIRAELIDLQSGRELAVTGLQAGTTTLMLWFADQSEPSGESIVSYLVRVYEDPVLSRPLDEVERELNQKFPDSFVELSDMNGRLMVSGQARDAIEMAQILQVLISARGVNAGVRRVAPVRTVSSLVDFSTSESLEAEAQEADARSLVDPVALAQAGIINLMRVPGEQQVMLRVTVAEVNRTAARSLGLNFTAIQNNNLFSNTTGSVAGNVRALLDGGDLSLRIEALRRLSLSRTLAEPNLVAINGQPANFLAGGQFPIPVIASGGIGNNLQGVQFVPFGVQLRFIPVIQDRDVIRLQINADISTRDEALGTSIGGAVGGTSVPGLNSRNFSSTVELRSGQTLAVAGLLQTNFGANSERLPWLGDLPIVGPLTGANRTSAAEQELVILVTPELVAPVDSCSTPGLPGNDVYEPTDVEFFLSNRLESRRSRDFRSPVRTDYHKQRRPDLCCPDRFIIGSSGPTDRCCNRTCAGSPSADQGFRRAAASDLSGAARVHRRGDSTNAQASTRKQGSVLTLLLSTLVVLSVGCRSGQGICGVDCCADIPAGAIPAGPGNHLLRVAAGPSCLGVDGLGGVLPSRFRRHERSTQPGCPASSWQGWFSRDRWHPCQLSSNPVTIPDVMPIGQSLWLLPSPSLAFRCRPSKFKLRFHPPLDWMASCALQVAERPAVVVCKAVAKAEVEVAWEGVALVAAMPI